jgi:hypothetical protein
MEDVMASKDIPGALGFLPWRGPIKVLAKQPTTVALVADIATAPTVKVAKAPKVKAVKVAKAPKVAKVAKVAKVSNKQTYADGSIVFRADRNKYMAWFGGKSEAARPTVDAAKSFLTKKYGITEFIMIDKE